MKKTYHIPALAEITLHVETMMSVPSVSGGSGIEDAPGKGEGEAPDGPGAKPRKEDIDPLLGHDSWNGGLW